MTNAQIERKIRGKRRKVNTKVTAIGRKRIILSIPIKVRGKSPKLYGTDACSSA